MPFEHFQRKQKVLNDLMEAVNTIQELLPDLTLDEMQNFLEGMESIISSERMSRRGGGVTFSVSTPRSRTEAELPSPAKAVEQLLATASPAGMSANEIVNALEGKVKTSSEKPRDVLYSAIAWLKNSNKLRQLPSKNYILAPIGVEVPVMEEGPDA
ncbi:MAG: hypothetical protein U0792_08710 [Gemmataceae bacterium]